MTNELEPKFKVPKLEDVDTEQPVAQGQEKHVKDVAMEDAEQEKAENDADESKQTQTKQQEDESLPCTPEELQTCIKVLGILGKNTSVVERKCMRDFRKVLAPVTEYMENRMFGGKGRKKYLEDKQLKEEKRARHNQRKMHDKRHINSSSLRRERLSKLEQLLQQGKENALPLIADGVAGESDCHTTMGLICDESSQAKTTEALTTTSSSLKKEENQEKKLIGFRSCYICKTRFDELHHFYDQLCPRCAKLNFTKRFQTCNLSGKVALITGARVKIGFQATIKLLLSGAAVIATTRFPRDAAERFAQHPEYASFKDRLQIFGIDFRDLIHVEQFLDFVLTHYSRLDVIVHNACQTVRRPPKYYSHLITKETDGQWLLQNANTTGLLQHQTEFQAKASSASASTPSLENGGGLLVTNGTTANSTWIPSALKTQVPLVLEDSQEASELHFPTGLTDVNGQQIDLRAQNSWLLKLGQVSTPEVAEVFAINTLTPFIMNNRLIPLMEKGASAQEKKFIVNVSAMEGKFYRYKTPNHPHTNMAKAALNMMTRTCAEDLGKNHIYMNSVDTGWINDENPLAKAHAHAQEANFQTPIDEIDAAARILDPVFDGYVAAKPLFGKFLKDYHVTEW